MARNLFLFAALATAGLSLVAAQSAWAQSNPSLKHFYMARQQIQLTDDAPLVNDQRTNPGAATPGAAGGNMGAMNRPVSLPRAGFQQYSSTMPGFNTSLPQVVNGVPPKEPPPAATAPAKQGKKGKAGKYKPEGKSTAKADAPPPVTAAKAYSPYKGYSPGAGSGNGASTAANMQSKTRVKGSILHWARGH